MAYYILDTYEMMQQLFPFYRTVGGLQYSLVACILLCINECYGKNAYILSARP